MNYTKKEMLSKCETISSFLKRSTKYEVEYGETNDYMQGHPRKKGILPHNEFLRRHSNYIENLQKKSVERFIIDDVIKYIFPHDMEYIASKCWNSYVESYKYDCYGLLEWKHRLNKEYKNTPYPAINYEHNGTLEEYCGSTNPFK
tara:strand:+ start:441 stop:875 length:435 start_codon:yes stop_codon:yes gene_type:complete